MNHEPFGPVALPSTLARAVVAIGVVAAALACSSQASPQPQPAPATGCLSQAAPAEHYRKQLEGFFKRTSPEAVVTWSQDSTICRHALAAAAFDQAPAQGAPYVYEISGAGLERYVVLWPEQRSGELAVACRYDDAWLRAGDCLGV